jgi:hypothetical protein
MDRPSADTSGGKQPPVVSVECAGAGHAECVDASDVAVSWLGRQCDCECHRGELRAVLTNKP